jgi:hypothetical protein
MRRRVFLIGLGLALAGAAFAIDHDKIEAGRPLRFDDAQSLHFREMTFDVGGGINLMRDRRVGGDFELEFGYGFALDSHLKVGITPRWGGGRSLEAGDVELEVFHALRREFRHSPALAVKAGVHVPTRGGSTSYQLRGIASRTVAQYDRVILNVDAEFKPSARGDELGARFGAVLGYARPLGLPTHFDTTGLAEVALYQSEHRGRGPTLSVGLGIRRQVTMRSVLDVGIQSDVVSPRGEGVPLRFVMGYSSSF